MSFDPLSLAIYLATASKNSEEVADIQTQLDNLIPGFNYQGSVATVADLPASAEKGTSYTVTAEGNALYVYNGSEWIKYNSDVVTKAQIDAFYR